MRGETAGARLAHMGMEGVAAEPNSMTSPGMKAHPLLSHSFFLTRSYVHSLLRLLI